MINNIIIVKESKIHSLGVFATKKINKGDIVLNWDLSNILSIKQVNALPAEEKSYVTLLKDKKYVLLKSPERYVNHSCNPNTNQINSADVAICTINKGEEITADYRKQFKPNRYMKCNCKNQNCDKIIKN